MSLGKIDQQQKKQHGSELLGKGFEPGQSGFTTTQLPPSGQYVNYLS